MKKLSMYEPFVVLPENVFINTQNLVKIVPDFFENLKF